MSSLDGALAVETVPSAADAAPPVDPYVSAPSNPTVPLDDALDPKAEPAEDEPMEDLFGEEQETEVAKRETEDGPSSAASHISDTEVEHRRAMEYNEDDDPEPTMEIQQQEGMVEMPNIPVPHSSDGNHWVIRMPNFVQVDSKPFHADTYMGPEDDDLSQADSAREKSMSVKLKVENTVRWRWTKDQLGADRRQSNGRIIRWSDGTLSLRLGKELFDITQTVDTSAAAPHLVSSQSQSQLPLPTPGPSQSQATGVAKNRGLTYLVAQHKRAGILQAEAHITGHMTLRPTGMQSETHRMLVRAVGQKHNKVARLRMTAEPTRDPELLRAEEAKKDKRSRKPRERDMDDPLGGGAGRRRGRTSGGSGRKKQRRDTADVWSDEDDEEPEYYGSDDDDGAGFGAGRRSKPKEDGRKRGGEYETDDFLVADSDEEGDGEDEDRPKRKKGKRSQEQEEEDPLDKLEAQIERSEEIERRKPASKVPKDAGGDGDDEDATGDVDVDADGDVAMDVESEDEDDEFSVRRAGGGGGRKKRTAAADDEEE